MIEKNTYLFYDRIKDNKFIIKGIDSLTPENIELYSELEKRGITNEKLINGECTAIRAEKTYFSSPHQIMLEVTKKCNFKCFYCCAEYHTEDKNDELTVEELEKLVDEIIDLKPNIVTFTGGEPFLREVKHHDLLKSIKKLSDNGINCNMFTNGSLISKYATQIPSLGLYNIRISIDTAIDEELKSIAATSVPMQNIWDGLSVLSQNGINFDVNAVISRKNYQNIEKLIKILSEFNVDIITFTRALPIGACKSKKEALLSNAEWEEFSRRVSSLSSSYHFSNITPKSALCPRGNIFDGCSTCKAGTSYVLIERNGNVIPCVADTDKIIGNIKNKTLKEIWHDNGWKNCREEGMKCFTQNKDLVKIKKLR